MKYCAAYLTRRSWKRLMTRSGQASDATQQVLRRNDVVKFCHREQILLPTIRSMHHALTVSFRMSTTSRTQTSLNRQQITNACQFKPLCVR